MESPSIQATGLKKSYGNVCVVNDVSFSVHPGEIVGVLGPNGAGKSTTIKMLYGAVAPDRGTVRIGEFDILRQGRDARSLLGIVSQDGDLDNEFSVFDNLAVYASFFGIPRSVSKASIGKLLSRLELADHQEKKPEQLSGGLRRKAAFARAMVSDAPIIFLDEPTTGLDPDARQEFWRLVIGLRDENRAVLLTTHYMDEAERLCDRVLLMQKGKIVREGTPSELIRDIVGEQLIEVEGIAEAAIGIVAKKFQVNFKKYGMGFTLPVPQEDRGALFDALRELSPLRVAERRANLEDVFLTLTGEELE